MACLAMEVGCNTLFTSSIRQKKLFRAVNSVFPAILCVLMIMLQFAPQAWAGLFTHGRKQVTQERAFLPPIASINPKYVSPEQANTKASQDLGPVTLMASTSPLLLKTHTPIQRLDNDLQIPEASSDAKTVISLQRELEDADLKALWNAIVEKNPVIRFSLEKLSTPADIQPQKSSLFLRKTLNLMISGAALGSSLVLPSGNAYQNMGVMASGDALRNLVNGPQPASKGAQLSATEQIQLASLIDDLRNSLIQNYNDYKNSLEALSIEHKTTLHNNELYSKALESGNDVATMAAATAYYKSMLQENQLRQKAKMLRLSLERLAGTTVVNQLYLILPVSALGNTPSAVPPSTKADNVTGTSKITAHASQNGHPASSARP